MGKKLTMFLAFSFLTAVLAFAYAAYLYLWVKKQQTVNKRINEVAELIKQGANTFMRREYKVLAMFSAFLVGLRGGAVMGLLVVGCSLFGVAAVLWIVGDDSILLGFSMFG